MTPTALRPRRRLTSILAALAVTTFAAGSVVGANAGCHLCTANIVPSVSLTVRDDASKCPEDVSIAYKVDGAAQPVTTVSLAIADDGTCSGTVTLGEELDGAFEIHATSGDGARSGTTNVDVSADACHVQTEQAVISLK